MSEGERHWRVRGKEGCVESNGGSIGEGILESPGCEERKPAGSSSQNTNQGTVDLLFFFVISFNKNLSLIFFIFLPLF